MTHLSKPANPTKTTKTVVDDLGQYLNKNDKLNVPPENYPLVSFNPLDR